MFDPAQCMSQAEAVLTQRRLASFLGGARLLRFIRAGWLTAAECTPSKVLYRVKDVHAALRRLEHEPCPPDQIAVAAVRASELRRNRAYKKKGLRKPGPAAIELDLSAF